ncbi:MAG TPA: D-alanyl-D-alanine carboxypeptidase/D-alanyl-D-alanine-endopeptidase [Myxococcota bacterium]|nr:D-alanyl-D-alanine carboxypeptidase/D-alanyl-D-alanine-endopeptidase [Myxococcota bacterium]HQK50531.1 D-alanyl-D-alanine carboxypeptidase/D-alanyl-D-alanine-endopeptidase [Myxococcota bacterium]
MGRRASGRAGLWTVSCVAPFLLAVPVLAGPAPDLLAPLKALESRGARVGAIMSRGDRVLAAHRADEPRNPASVSKVFTGAAALDRLGPEFRFVTTSWRFASGGKDGVAIRASGDPTLTRKSLEEMARCLQQQGVRRIARLVLDPGGLDPGATPPRFDRKATLAPYRAGAAPFQVDLGAVTLTVRPGKPGEPTSASLSTTSDRVVLDNRSVTAGGSSPGARKDPFRVRAREDPDGRLVIQVSGRLSGRRVHVESFRVPDPQGHALGAFQQALKDAGIAVSSAGQPGTVPPGAREVCRVESAPLAEILVPMIRDSLNPVAEAILRELGRPAGKGEAPRVGFAGGVTALHRFLRDQVGIPEAGARFRNGSGLYDANEVTPEATVHLLRWVRAQPWFPVFRETLAVAGADTGTMRRRLKGSPLEGRVRAKTGTLDRVVSLAGYLELPDGDPVEFAFLVEGPPCPSEGRKCPGWDRNEVRGAMDRALVGLWNTLVESGSAQHDSRQVSGGQVPTQFQRGGP